MNAKKRVLVVGANSYIGDSFRRYAKGRLFIDVVDSHEEWKTASFDGYDSVLVVAGIAHQKQTAANKDLYFAINRDLAVDVAKKAKASGVGQFVYLSSMAVYGLLEGEITEDTLPSPREGDYYGQSKYQAENELMALFGMDSCLCIIRPPMVYGPGCPGKFSTLIKVAKILPFIPKINNQRSMIYIDNLSELLCIVVEQVVSGVLKPHNREYMNTTRLLASVLEAMGKKRPILSGFGWLIRLAMWFSPMLKTAFGSLYYTKAAAKMPFNCDYQIASKSDDIL